MAAMRGEGLPLTITAAEIVPCFNRSMARLASRLCGSTSMPSALNSAEAVTEEPLPAGPKFTFLPARSVSVLMSARPMHVNLLRIEPGDQFEMLRQILPRRLGLRKGIGRDEGDIDMRLIEQERDIAFTRVSQHGQDAERLPRGEEARHVGSEHGLGGRGGPSCQPEPIRRRVLRGYRRPASLRASARNNEEQGDAHHDLLDTQHTTPNACPKPARPQSRLGYDRICQGAAIRAASRAIPAPDAPYGVRVVLRGPGQGRDGLLVVVGKVNARLGRDVVPIAAKPGLARRGPNSVRLPAL